MSNNNVLRTQHKSTNQRKPTLSWQLSSAASYVYFSGLRSLSFLNRFQLEIAGEKLRTYTVKSSNKNVRINKISIAVRRDIPVQGRRGRCVGPYRFWFLIVDIIVRYRSSHVLRTMVSHSCYSVSNLLWLVLLWVLISFTMSSDT